MALFRWENFSQLNVHPKLSFFQNEGLGPYIDDTSSGATGPVDFELYRGATGSTGPQGASGAIDEGLGQPGGIGGTGALGTTGPIVVINGEAIRYIGGTGATGPQGPTGAAGPALPCIPMNPAIITIENGNIYNGVDISGTGSISIGGIVSPYYGVTLGTYTFISDIYIAIASPDPDIYQTWQNGGNITTELNYYTNFVDMDYLIEEYNTGVARKGNTTFAVQAPFTTPFSVFDIHGNVLCKFYYKPSCNAIYNDKDGIVPPQTALAKIRNYPFGLEGFGQNTYYIVDDTGTPAIAPHNVLTTNTPPEEVYEYITTPQPFPFYKQVSYQSDVYFYVTGIYSVLAEGEYKLKKSPLGTYGSNTQYLFALVDESGTQVVRNNQGIIVYWNGTDEFSFTAYGRSEDIPDTVLTDIQYTIVGRYSENSEEYFRLKQPLLGTYANDTQYYNIINDASQLVYDPITSNTQLVAINWTGTPTVPFSGFASTSTTDNGIFYNIVGIYTTLANGTYKLKQNAVDSDIYTLVTLTGTTVPDPGTNNTSNVTIQWNGTDGFPFVRTPYSGYRVVRYNITGLYSDSSAGKFTLKQGVVDDAPADMYYLLDSDLNIVRRNDADEFVIYTSETFPLLLPSIYSDSVKYFITGIKTIIQGDYKIVETQTANVYKVVRTDGVVVTDEGTNNTTDTLVTWNGTDTFPIERFSNSGYNYIKYRIVGTYTTPSVTITTGPTGPSSGGDTGAIDSSGFDLGGGFATGTYTPSTGPTGSYTGPITVDPLPTEPEQSGPNITNNLTSSVNIIIGGGYGLYISTKNNDITRMFSIE